MVDVGDWTSCWFNVKGGELGKKVLLFELFNDFLWIVVIIKLELLLLWLGPWLIKRVPIPILKTPNTRIVDHFLHDIFSTRPEVTTALIGLVNLNRGGEGKGCGVQK